MTDFLIDEMFLKQYEEERKKNKKKEKKEAK